MSRVIRVPDEIYDALRELKWTCRKETFGDVLEDMLNALCYDSEQTDFDDFDQEDDEC